MSGSRARCRALREAAEAAPIGGDELIHLDVRSDNVCIRDRRATVVGSSVRIAGAALGSSR